MEHTMEQPYPGYLDPVVEVVGQWAITEYGLESIARWPNGGFIEYPIEKSRLWEMDWYGHMVTKLWVNSGDFAVALARAQQIHAEAHPPRKGATMKARQRYEILKRDGFRCQICGRTAVNGVTLEVDHILPRSKGGSDHPNNLRTLCKDCNLGRSNRP